VPLSNTHPRGDGDNLNVDCKQSFYNRWG